MLIAALTCSATLVAVMPLDVDAATASSVAAPQCDAVGRYFEERLELTIESSRNRAFDVRAVLALEPGANEASVLHDADEQVRELFEPNARSVYNEHLRFGAAESHLAIAFAMRSDTFRA